jgi:hypothetical protein
VDQDLHLVGGDAFVHMDKEILHLIGGELLWIMTSSPGWLGCCCGSIDSSPAWRKGCCGSRPSSHGWLG